MVRQRIGRVKKTKSAFFRFCAAVLVVLLHAAPAAAILLGTRRLDWLACALLYLWGSFGVVVGLHRYFAHHAFRTGRAFQFFMAVTACTTLTDPITFAGKHRIHHRNSDTAGDVHSPDGGFWFCWFGSLFDDGYTDEEIQAMAKDWTRFPELRWLHRYFWAPSVALGAATYAVGGLPMFAIGFCLSRVLIIHGASAVNYFCHLFGTQRYATGDRSRNNTLVAWLTFGEGWHNNHHHFPAAARAGFFWWEVDFAYCLIRALAALGIVWDVREVPETLKTPRPVGAGFSPAPTQMKT